MIELAFMLITVVGMLAAFYLGAKKGEEKIINRRYEPENMDVPEEVSEEEYMKSLRTWKSNGEKNITE